MKSKKSIIAVSVASLALVLGSVSPASISAKSESVDESIYFANRKTAMEVEGAITEANLSFLRDNIRIVIAKLQNWLIPE